MNPVSYNASSGQAYEVHPSAAGLQVEASYDYSHQPPPTAPAQYDAWPPQPVYTGEPLPHAAAALPLPPAGGYRTDYSQQVAPPPYGQAPHYVAQSGAPLEYTAGRGALTQPPPPAHYGQAVYYQQPQLSSNVTVATSPPVVIVQPSTERLQVNSYMGWSIFNFLCCCCPLGLAAVIFSAKVSSARSAEESRRYSLTARNLNIAATVIAPVLVCIILPSVYLAPRSLGKSTSVYFENTRSRSRFESYSYYDTDYYYYYSYGSNIYSRDQKTGYRYVTYYEYFIDFQRIYS